MKPKATNSTVNYEPQVVNPQTSLVFTKVINGNNITIHGTMVKNETEVGTISYDKTGDYLIISFKPYSGLTAEEITAISTLAPKCVAEAINS